MSQLSELTERFLQLQRGNVQLEDQLLGTKYMPEGYESTVGQKTGPQGFLENAANFFGAYEDTRTKDLLQKAKSNRSLLVQAQKRMAQAEKDKLVEDAKVKKEENKVEEALDQQNVINRELELAKELGQISSQLQREAGDISTEQSIRQMQALYPYLNQAGIEATERALSASQRYKAFKEMLPSNIQAIMESKQRQQQLASDAFAREAGAVATQQQAATGMAGLGLGRRFG